MESIAVIKSEAAQQALRNHFLGWQCRLRQMSIRQAQGKPTSGMRPAVYLADAEQPIANIVVLIIKSESDDLTAQFRHMARKTHDPADRYAAALKFLAAAYYQRAHEFSDYMTALFSQDAALASALLKQGHCRLEFEQYSQRYVLPCSVHHLTEQDSAYQATYWHNILFNPQLPGAVTILQFRPDWALAESDPAMIDNRT